MKKMWIGLMIMSLSGFVFADNCDNVRNAYDDIYCSNKLYASADAELNKNYQLLRTKLTTNQKTTLKRSQVAWIRERDAQCSDEAERTVFVNCNLEKTQQRNAWLRERIRECDTIGCKNSALN